MKSEHMFELNGQKMAIDNGQTGHRRDARETKRKKWVVSIIDAKPESHLFLKEYFQISRCLELGHWCRAELRSVHEIAFSSCDSVLVDAHLPCDRGIQNVYILKKLRPAIAVVILDDNPDLARFIRFAQAGADGVFRIPGTKQLFEQTVQEAINGGKPFPMEIRKRIFDHLARHFAPANGKRLTQAETEILVGLLDGKRDKEIASDRQIKEGTVHAITNSLYRKLKAHSRSELVQRFLPLGETFRTVRELSPPKLITEPSEPLKEIQPSSFDRDTKSGDARER